MFSGTYNDSLAVQDSNSHFCVMEMDKKIRKNSKLKYFKPSFICMGIYWGIIVAFTILRNEIVGIVIFLSGIFGISGMILAHKALNDSWMAIRKYDEKIKMDAEVRSPDDYFEIFSRAENVEIDISKLKKKAPTTVVDAIMQREAGKLIPFLHLAIIYLTVLMLCATSWMPVSAQ